MINIILAVGAVGRIGGVSREEVRVPVFGRQSFNVGIAVAARSRLL